MITSKSGLCKLCGEPYADDGYRLDDETVCEDCYEHAKETDDGR